MRSSVLAVVSLGLILALPGAARKSSAGEILDQSQEQGGDFYAFYQPQGCPSAGVKAAAQTFTAGLSGFLTRVQLDLSRPTWTTGIKGMFIEIHAGGPTGVLLATSNVVASADIPLDPAYAWTSFTFTEPAAIVAGQVLAIVLPPDLSTDSNVDPTFLWTGAYADVYPAGVTWDYYCSNPSAPWQAYVFGSDRTFRTYVDASFTSAVRPSWGALKSRYR